MAGDDTHHDGQQRADAQNPGQLGLAMAFSKLKSLLRAKALRTMDALEGLGSTLKHICPGRVYQLLPSRWLLPASVNPALDRHHGPEPPQQQNADCGGDGEQGHADRQLQTAVDAHSAADQGEDHRLWQVADR